MENKFGHLTSKNGRAEVVVNSLFQDLRIPEEVIKVTIAHEIVHYMHGFHSHLPKQFSHPHKGNIVNKELIKRGFKHTLKMEKEWYKKTGFLSTENMSKRPVKTIQPKTKRWNLLQWWQ